MTGPTFVNRVEALRIGTARIAAFDQAIACLGATTLAGNHLVPQRDAWESAVTFLSGCPEHGDVAVQSLADSAQMLAFVHQRNAAKRASVVGWCEIYYLLRTDYDQVAAKVAASQAARHMPHPNRQENPE